MSTEICKICEEESTPWFHINGHICDACYCAAKERNKSEWISVENEPVPLKKEVLISYPDKDIAKVRAGFIVFPHDQIIKCVDDDGIYLVWVLIKSITHWRPLPEPPE